MWTTGCRCRFVFLLRSVSVSEVPTVGPDGYRYWVGCVSVALRPQSETVGSSS